MTAGAYRALVIDGATLAGSAGVPVSIRIEGDGIVVVGPAAADRADGAARHFDGAGLIVAPGFIELQINGAAGHDLTTEPEAVWCVGSALGRYGVTAFVPTLVSPAWAIVDRAMAAFLAGPPPDYNGATPLGWHVEGPFLSPKRAGAHDPAALRPPALSAVEGWSPAAGIRIVTLAPELPGAIHVVRALVARGITVSAGHSAATYAEARAGFDAGIRSVTHLFNAMGPLDHREPGLAGAAIEDPAVIVGLIPDGIHVHPAVVSMVRAAVGAGRVAIVTDAIAALGMPPGSHRLADREVDVDETSARLADGVLAGSVLAMDQGIRNLAMFAGREIADALLAATAVPASLLGEPGRGALRVGNIADVTLVSADFEVVLTIAAGRVAYDDGGSGRWA